MPMTPERLAEIRHAYARWDMNSGNWGTMNIADMVPELLKHIDDLTRQNAELRDSVVQITSIVDDLTRQRDDARRIAIDSGAFQAHKGTDYDFEEYDPHDGCMRWRDDTWRADPVGPVAWDRQVEQR